MNIDEIRAEIRNAFTGNWIDTEKWIRENGFFDWCVHSIEDDYRKAANILVDWAYEAGKAEGIEEGFKNGRSVIEKSLGEGGLQAINDTVAYQEGYEAAAKNPKAWYVLDMNGERVHIGDTVKNGDGVKEITGLGNTELFAPWWSGSPACSFEKVVHETREKIKKELTAALYENAAPDIDVEDAVDLAEQFISRIEALERD